MSIEFLFSNPLRPVDWKWKRAIEIVEGAGTRPARSKDGIAGFKWINRAITFLRAFRRCETDHQREVLAGRYPDIFWAHYIFGQTGHPQKSAIEAHILARETNLGISRRCLLSEASIEAYEQLFFNVRDSLANRSYIINCALGPAVHRHITDRDYDLLWKMYGYFLGPNLVDALEGKFTAPLWCSDEQEVGAAILDDAIKTMKMKASLASKTVPVAGHTQLALLDQFTKFIEVERSTDSVGKSQEQILSHISAMMNTLPFTVGDQPATRMDTGAELTYEELMRVSVGDAIARANELQTVRFPEAAPLLLEHKP